LFVEVIPAWSASWLIW